ncbi:MAG: non-heme iron oxygenase ferredoxin subunit [Acidiferrobacterales bacterium]
MSGNFVKAASARAIRPGTMQRVEIAGSRILLANVDGRFYAVDDTCSHEDASLSTGSLKGELVKCPLHGSRFNVCTGKVLEEPASENLRTYAVRVDGDDILIAPA